MKGNFLDYSFHLCLLIQTSICLQRHMTVSFKIGSKQNPMGLKSMLTIMSKLFWTISIHFRFIVVRGFGSECGQFGVEDLLKDSKNVNWQEFEPLTNQIES